MKPDFSERDLRSLRVFCAAANAGGFAAAERQLNMSKASISRHVRDVETRLGAKLCTRGPSGFKLTDAGVVALEVAEHALKSLAQIKPQIDAVRGVLSGPLKIGMVEHILTDNHCHLAESLADLKRQAPDVRPELVVMTYAQLGEALRERHVQIAVRGMYKKQRGLDYLPLFIEEHRIFISALNRGRTPKVLPLVFRPHPFVEEAFGAYASERGPDAGGLEAIAMFVSSGDYAGILPSHYAQMVSRRHKLVTVPGSPVYSNVICAITEISRPRTRALDLFLEILAARHQGET